MNNLAFIQKLVEANKLEYHMPMEFYKDEIGVAITYNKKTYRGATFDQCVAAIKESLAISYLEIIERQ